MIKCKNIIVNEIEERKHFIVNEIEKYKKIIVNEKAATLKTLRILITLTSLNTLPTRPTTIVSFIFYHGQGTRYLVYTNRFNVEIFSTLKNIFIFKLLDSSLAFTHLVFNRVLEFWDPFQG